MSFAEALIRGAVAAVFGFTFVGIALVILNWFERKMGGRIQSRHGPMHVGFHGILQTFADLLKLLQKEYIIPKGADRLLFITAPLMVLIPAIFVFLVVPFSPKLAAIDFKYSLLFVLIFPALSSFGILAAGWASNSKYSLIASVRTIGQMLSYEIPRTLSALSVAMVAGSFSLVEIVEKQAYIWFFLLQPVAFFLFFFTSLAEANRMPFDFTWAESELVSGFFTEYTGMRWALFFLGEYGALVSSCLVASLLFFGGWYGPLLPGVIWVIIKTAILIVFSLWIRWTWPRLRIDQWIRFSWKFLIPLSIVNLLATAVLILSTGVKA
jgi:NADH-quinone oxidoreductase subunit H